MGPQEYVLIKMEVLELSGKLAALEGEAVRRGSGSVESVPFEGDSAAAMACLPCDSGSNSVPHLCTGQGVRVFLMAATLRPETMYGQTNCWVLPEGQYGAYRGLGGEVYVMTQRSALNLSYQVGGCGGRREGGGAGREGGGSKGPLPPQRRARPRSCCCCWLWVRGLPPGGCVRAGQSRA